MPAAMKNLTTSAVVGAALFEIGSSVDLEGRSHDQNKLQAMSVGADGHVEAYKDGAAAAEDKVMKGLQEKLEVDLGMTPTAEQKAAFQAMDQDGDGLVSYKEYQDKRVDPTKSALAETKQVTNTLVGFTKCCSWWKGEQPELGEILLLGNPGQEAEACQIDVPGTDAPVSDCVIPGSGWGVTQITHSNNLCDLRCDEASLQLTKTKINDKLTLYKPKEEYVKLWEASFEAPQVQTMVHPIEQNTGNVLGADEFNDNPWLTDDVAGPRCDGACEDRGCTLNNAAVNFGQCLLRMQTNPRQCGFAIKMKPLIGWEDVTDAMCWDNCQVDLFFWKGKAKKTAWKYWNWRCPEVCEVTKENYVQGKHETLDFLCKTHCKAELRCEPKQDITWLGAKGICNEKNSDMSACESLQRGDVKGCASKFVAVRNGDAVPA